MEKSIFRLCHGYLNYPHQQETEGANENWAKSWANPFSLHRIFKNHSKSNPVCVSLAAKCKNISQYAVSYEKKNTFGQRKGDFSLSLINKLFPSVKVGNCNSAKPIRYPENKMKIPLQIIWLCILIHVSLPNEMCAR